MGTRGNYKDSQESYSYLSRAKFQAKRVICRNGKFIKGKHRGELVQNVEKTDPQYCEWARKIGLI